MTGKKKIELRGGARLGSGRKPGPPELVRRNRLVITLTDSEFAKLKKWARFGKLPTSTLAYDFVARALKRRK